MRRHGQLDLILVLPDGTKSLIPSTWTDLTPGTGGNDDRAETLAPLRDLLHVRTVVDVLVRRLRDARE